MKDKKVKYEEAVARNIKTFKRYMNQHVPQELKKIRGLTDLRTRLGIRKDDTYYDDELHQLLKMLKAAVKNYKDDDDDQ